MIRRFRILLALLPMLAMTSQLVAQDPAPDPPPPEGALFLLLPVGAEGVSLGRAMTAVTTPEAAFWNPAGLASLAKSEFLIMRGDPLAGVSTAISWLMVRQPLGVLGLSYHLLDGGEQNIVDPQGNIRGSFTIRSQVGIVSAATPLARWLEVGLNMKIVRFDLSCRGQCDDAGVRASGWSGDVGFQSQPLAGVPLRLGAMVAHFGPKFQVVNAAQADPLPTRIRLSAAYEILRHFDPPADLALWIRVEVEDRWTRPGESASFYVGTELVAGSTNEIFLRASRASGEINQTAEIAFGLGLRYESFELALARSFASSIVEDSEPVYVSFGIRF
ncbi:MAG: hypothetical protein IH921_10670 [Gemmatimonadetes bacterium]|nr:hypothetical protein [Gemmatimonadota bacterium]